MLSIRTAPFYCLIPFNSKLKNKFLAFKLLTPAFKWSNYLNSGYSQIPHFSTKFFRLWKISMIEDGKSTKTCYVIPVKNNIKTISYK